MSLFLRYQTSVQREYDKAISEFKKAKGTPEAQSSRPCWRPQAARFPAVASLRKANLTSRGISGRRSSAFIGGPKPTFPPPTRHITFQTESTNTVCGG